MNYEIKGINPLLVLFNSARIFTIVGLLVGIISFFIIPNPNIRISAWWQKLVATGLFTLVYGVVVSLVLSLIAFLYNFWTTKFKGITIRLEQEASE